MKKYTHLLLSITLMLILILPAQATPTHTTTINVPTTQNYTPPQHLTLNLTYSYPTIHIENQSIWVYVNETDLNIVKQNHPTIPTTINTFTFPLGTQILDITYSIPPPEIINLTYPLHLTSKPYNYDTNTQFAHLTTPTQTINQTYPSDWYSYHTGGGLTQYTHTTFLILRTYPIRYQADTQQLHYINHINLTITYQEPNEPLIAPNDIVDLLIIAPTQFHNELKPLIKHKETHNIKTKLVSLKEIQQTMYWEGRDLQEKTKYYIKNAIEHWGISHVLLVGGLKGQTLKWNLPVRYSHVVPPEEQEYAEQNFISDLYYADIYDSNGDFITWDSNNNNIFAEWNQTYKETMDLYPDVYLGRLPCRTNHEARVMVRKIIQYEKRTTNTDWFNTLFQVYGDSYNDEDHANEGELIAAAAKTVMPNYTYVDINSSLMDINQRTVNKALNKGAGFAYFCGHGNPMSWTTHFPPDGKNWTTGYTVGDMIYLRNGYKLPITIVGGCHNGQFDVSLGKIIEGIKNDGLQYFRSRPPAGRFWWNEWSPNCWAWWLTSKVGGGAIATIANTGLGTHGDGDLDRNGIHDYIEVLDGWLELRFLQLYGQYTQPNLGENHGQTMTEYLHRFIGSNQKMDVKMVQQWELFGDPSLQIGGYSKQS